eukprot:TRINITY_DN9210_c2_g2_i1.p2 TRINITY_DN9210_c2_g2~~TRINITY_DN9210_c2_g2_i1.p2  ORF type:complete len:176 (+),score=42.26 TRINITY_DN9210_c2_g2_i1:68-529(+)
MATTAPTMQMMPQQQMQVPQQFFMSSTQPGVYYVANGQQPQLQGMQGVQGMSGQLTPQQQQMLFVHQMPFQHMQDPQQLQQLQQQQMAPQNMYVAPQIMQQQLFTQSQLGGQQQGVVPGQQAPYQCPHCHKHFAAIVGQGQVVCPYCQKYALV